MSGFATGGRVERVSPRLARGRADRSAEAEATLDEEAELIDVRTADPLIDRWAAFRARWSALTFYLFDPQSWR
jgi:hypothetical protein